MRSGDGQHMRVTVSDCGMKAVPRHTAPWEALKKHPYFENVKRVLYVIFYFTSLYGDSVLYRLYTDAYTNASNIAVLHFSYRRSSNTDIGLIYFQYLRAVAWTRDIFLERRRLVTARRS